MAVRFKWAAAVRRGGLTFLTLLAVTTPTRAACKLTAQDGAFVAEGGVSLAWRTEPAAIAVGQPFVLTVKACPAGAELLRVDASMPEHRHGMNYHPTLHPLGNGRWRVEGLLWHMSGRWEWRFDLRTGETVHSLRPSVTLR